MNSKFFHNFFFKNSKIQAIKVGLQFQDNTRNRQGNGPKMALLCPQISPNEFEEKF